MGGVDIIPRDGRGSCAPSQDDYLGYSCLFLMACLFVIINIQLAISTLTRYQTHAHTYTHTHKRMHTHTHICTNTCTHTCKHMHAHTHTHTTSPLLVLSLIFLAITGYKLPAWLEDMQSLLTDHFSLIKDSVLVKPTTYWLEIK